MFLASSILQTREVTQPQSLFDFPPSPVTGLLGELSNDGKHYPDSMGRFPDFLRLYCLGSESEVSALRVGTYCFP